MPRHHFHLWFLIALTAVADAVWLPVRGMSLTGNALLLIFLPVSGLLALSCFYTTVRKNARIAALAHMSAATLAFMSASCILSYLMVTLRQPLIDPVLVRADEAIGLHWLAFYNWMKGHPTLHIGMQFVYMTLIPQIFVLQIILNFCGKTARAWESLWLFMGACMACVFLSGLWPAAGAFATFHVQMNEPYLHEFAAVRDGTLKIIGSRGGLQGVVEFPSLHMALAVLFPYAARGIRIVFPVFVVLDILVAMTTAPVGGHHYADLWAGAVLALLVIGISRFCCPETSSAPGRAGSPSGKKNAGRVRALPAFKGLQEIKAQPALSQTHRSKPDPRSTKRRR